MSNPVESPAKRLRDALRTHRDAALDVAWSGGAEMLAILGRIASFLMLGRLLGAQGYGVYLGLYGVINPIGSLSFRGLQLAVVQRGYRDGMRAKALVGRFTALAIAQGIIAIGVAVALSHLLLDGMSVLTVLGFAVAELLFIALVEVEASFVHVADTFKAAARVRIGALFVRTGTLTALFVTGMLTLDRLSAGLVVTTGLFAVYVSTRSLGQYGLRPRVGRPILRDVVLGAQLSSTLFAVSVQTDGDKAALNAYGLEREAGIYGAAYRIIMFALLPAQAVNNALVQRFLRPPAENDGGHVHMRRALQYSCSMGAVSLILVGLIFPASFLMDRILGPSFSEAEVALRWLLPLLPIVALNHGPSNGLAALDRVGVRTVVVVAAAAFSIAMYVVLIPGYGWRGAAIASVVGELALTIGLWAAFVMFERRQERTAIAN